MCGYGLALLRAGSQLRFASRLGTSRKTLTSNSLGPKCTGTCLVAERDQDGNANSYAAFKQPHVIYRASRNRRSSMPFAVTGLSRSGCRRLPLARPENQPSRLLNFAVT